MAKVGLNGHAYRQLRVYMKLNLPWVCWRCGNPISRELTIRNPRARGAWSADHTPIPRSMGGPSELWNMKPAHNKCNSEAGNSQRDNPQSRNW